MIKQKTENNHVMFVRELRSLKGGETLLFEYIRIAMLLITFVSEILLFYFILFTLRRNMRIIVFVKYDLNFR